MYLSLLHIFPLSLSRRRNRLHLNKHNLLPQLTHRPRKRTVALVRRLVSHVDGQRLWHAILKPILVERLPGSKGNRAVRKVRPISAH